MAVKSDFEKIRFYKDSAEKMKECDEKANEIDYAEAMGVFRNATTEQRYIFALSKFEKLGDYKDSAEMVLECRQKSREAANAAVYAEALEIFNSLEVDLSKQLDKFSKAKGEFERIRGYRDSEEKIKQCNERIKEIDNKKNEAEKIEKRKAIMRRTIYALASIVLITGGVYGIKCYETFKKDTYDNAIKAYEDNDIEYTLPTKNQFYNSHIFTHSSTTII
ncbi:MAG: hypothetical protein K6C68_02925 [Ruminococcus sp.]|nr:hypothetical protein [Ruminococcus sp.]